MTRVSKAQNKSPFSIRTSLLRALDHVWLAQPERVRVRVPAAQRGRARATIAGARSLIEAARRAESSEAQQGLAQRALRELLTLVAELIRDTDDARSVVSIGAARVEPTLRSERLVHALSDAHRPAEAIPPAHDSAIFELCDWVIGLVEYHSNREKRVRKVASWLVLGAATAALFYELLSPQNLAHGRKVTASSICDLTPPARYHEPRLSRVVDGNHYGAPAVNANWGQASFALCTSVEVHPWVKVDLGTQHRLSSATVYGRADCCWDDQLPVSIQVSSDDRHYETVETTRTPFTADFPWRASLDGRRARYVRLYSSVSRVRSVVVSEIEVYGR
jgi:hypothetical protein